MVRGKAENDADGRTNVLVRYLAQDDPGQSRKAMQLLTKQCTRSDPGFINRIVLCELEWGLERAYGYPTLF